MEITDLQSLRASLPALAPEIMESIVVGGDLSGLSKEHLVLYYQHYCVSLGLNPATKPFTVLSLKDKSGAVKKVMYAGREACAQLSKVHSVSHEVLNRSTDNGCYMVEVRAWTPDGRSTVSLGIVPVTQYINAEKPTEPLYGDTYANAIKKAETQAKRRAVLDLVGLGMLDSETESDNTYEPAPIQSPAPVYISTPNEPIHETTPTAAKKRTKKQLESDRGTIKTAMLNADTLEELEELRLSDEEAFSGNADMLNFYTLRRGELKMDAPAAPTPAAEVAAPPAPVYDDLDTPSNPDQDIYDALAKVTTKKERLDYMNSDLERAGKTVVDYVKEKGGALLEYAKKRREEVDTVAAAPPPPATSGRAL